MTEELALIMMTAGVGLDVGGEIEQGRQTMAIAEQRAQVDLENAAAVDKATDEQAKILEEKRIRTVATSKSDIAAGGIKLGEGLDLVIEAEINDTFWKEKKFGTEAGRSEAAFFRSRAGVERAVGKAAQKRSVWSAIGKGAIGFGSIAMMGVEAGLFESPFSGLKKGVGDVAGTVKKTATIAKRTVGQFEFTKPVRATKSFLGGAGRLNQGPKTLFDFNTGTPGGTFA